MPAPSGATTVAARRENDSRDSLTSDGRRMRVWLSAYRWSKFDSDEANRLPNELLLKIQPKAISPKKFRMVARAVRLSLSENRWSSRPCKRKLSKGLATPMR